MTGRRLFVVNCLAVALLAFVLAVNWWITIGNAGLWPLNLLAAGVGVAIGLFALYMALDVATR